MYVLQYISFKSKTCPLRHCSHYFYFSVFDTCELSSSGDVSPPPGPTQVPAVPGRRHLEAQTDQVKILSGTSILKRRTEEKTKTKKQTNNHLCPSTPTPQSTMCKCKKKTNYEKATGQQSDRSVGNGSMVKMQKVSFR